MLRIYARQTTIKPISNDIADAFITANHRDGNVRYGKNRYNIALYYNNELVAVAAFSNPRTKAKMREYQHELVRLAFRKNVRIVGGASKLIKGYINDVNPKNFFTYQTTSGENTDVYQLSGMTLRTKGKPKKWLVKNGYTAETAKASKTKYTYLNSQLVNLGPDAILGTTIGEVYENGKRLTNAELFIRYCDYHEEMVPGDNVYEYNNPNYTHYIYKITSSNASDPHYYIGRHSVYSEHPVTIDELLQDGYMGSGGNAYKDWVNSVVESGDTLVKTIVKVSKTFRANIKDEETILGDAYETDDNCLNAVKGGITLASTFFTIKATVKHCEKHGDCLHRGINCLKCLASKPISIKKCDTHGQSIHRGEHCLKCTSQKSITTNHCEIHGDVTFNGNTCVLCQSENMHNIKHCPIHGETMFKGDTCAKCTTEKGIEYKDCPIHGNTKHRANVCLACQVQSVPVVIKTCPIHGETKFKKDTCLKCSAVRPMGECPIHGYTKFSGGECSACRVANQYHMDNCLIHGYTKFRKDKCYKCSRMKHIPKVTVEECMVCQSESVHLDGKCKTCLENEQKGLYHCPIHGLCKHRNGQCLQCKSKSEKITEVKHCDICNKDARHVNGQCMSCKEQALYKELECPIHGLTKHRGKTCCKCRSEKQKLKRQKKNNN